MFKRKTRGLNRSQIPLTSVNRGSDIVAPNSSSLIVNQSKKTVESVEDEDEAALASLLADDDSEEIFRPSSSVMYSMSQKLHSTPRSQSVLSKSTVGSKENVPERSTLSQNTRSTFGGRATRASTRRSSAAKETLSFFLKTLQDCGATEIEGEGSFTLYDDQAGLSLKLHAFLGKDDNLGKFFTALKDYIDDFGKLKKLVMFTQTSAECDVARGPVQEPMLRLLLLVDCLQPLLLKLLMEKLAVIIREMDDFSLTSAILRQIRCLNRVDNTQFAAELFGMIDYASLDIQREIIFLLPELIGENEVQDAANFLVLLLNNGTELTPVVIDSLSNLPLNSTIRAEVRTKVLSRLGKCPSAYLPSLVQFSINRCDVADMAQIVAHLREHLPFTWRDFETRQSTQAPKNNKQLMERDSYVRLTMDNLKFSVMASKHLTDAFLKAVASVNSADNFRPVDFMMLTLIHGYVMGRKPTAITTLKNKIRNGVLLESHISQVFKIFRVVIAENHEEMLDLCSSLLRSFEVVVADFAISLYLEAFAVFGQFLRLDVVSSILQHITTGTPIAVQNALNLLTRLRDTHVGTKDIEEQAVSLMSTLTKIPDLDVLQVRQLVDVIASLVTSPTQDDTGLIDELQIFIRKQLSAWQPDIQKKGIVAAIMLVKHAALSGAPEAGINSPADKFEADFLLKMAMGSHGTSLIRRGFFYDEFAKMVKEIETLPKFLTGWRDRFFNQMKDQVFIADLDYGCDHFPISLQYSIENEDKLVFPILALLDNDRTSSNELPTLPIPSALRVLWCAEKDLTRITPMLCASVILPDVSVYDKFLSYQPQQQKLIMDSLFVCANFFIECVNALSMQKTSEKLVLRLKQLIEVRKLITDHVSQIPDYNPPVLQYHSQIVRPVIKKPTEGKRPAKGRKRKSDGTQVVNDANESHMDPLPSTSTAAPADAIAQVAQNPPSSDTTDLSAYSPYFRDIFCHAYRLLRMELKLNPTKVFKKKKMSDLISCDVSWSYRPEDKPELGPSDALYLLLDYVSKSELLLRERHAFLAKKSVGLKSESISPSVFLLGTVKMLPKLCLKLDIVSGYCKDLIEANDDIWDAPGMFPKESADIKMTFCAILKIIADILNWKSLQNPVHKPILKDALAALANKTATQRGTQSIESLAYEASLHLSKYCKVIPLLSGGVSIIRCLQACLPLMSQEHANLVSEQCEGLLQRPWYTLTAAVDHGPVYNQLVDSLLRTYFNSAEDRLTTVYKAVESASEEVPGLLGKDDTLPSFKALNKANFPLLFRAVCEALVSAAADELAKKKEDDESCLAVWAIVTRALLLLVEIAKVHTSRTNLAALLKRSQAIIHLFLSKGLPLMESALRIKSEEVLKILKSLQVTTRFLHSVCCHSKVTSDAMVAAHVPPIRSLCERLTLEVKGMLILNKIPLDLITIAVLKNRDIRGNDILTQSTTAPSDDESELPPETEDIPEVNLEVTIGDEYESDSD